MDQLEFIVTDVQDGVKRVELYYNHSEKTREYMGVMYYERGKRSFNRKPIGLQSWVCVDAKIEGLYTKEETITPTDIISMGAKKIMENER